MSRASALASRSRRFAAVLQLLIICALIVPGGRKFAHEVRPAYLELRETAPGLFESKSSMLLDSAKGNHRSYTIGLTATLLQCPRFRNAYRKSLRSVQGETNASASLPMSALGH